jgi:quercetin dioxygenase-like cupin family protein
MKHVNLYEAVTFDEENVVIDTLLETPFVREIRIAMYAHQVMRDHESEHPVMIEVCDGAVTLSLESQEVILPKGEVIAIAGGVKHHIEAIQDSILRLTIILALEGEAK